VLAAGRNSMDVTGAEGLYGAGIHLYGNVAQAKLPIFVHAPGPEHVFFFPDHCETVVLSAGNRLHIHFFKADHSTRHDYVRTQLLLLPFAVEHMNLHFFNVCV
jgi:hypothetical protein